MSYLFYFSVLDERTILENLHTRYKDEKIYVSIYLKTGWPLVREKSGKFDFSSRSGKSQGILQIGQGIFKYQESQGKVGIS